MILGDKERATTGDTLDDLFRRAGVRHPDAVALADPDNRETFTDGAPRTLTYAQADRAIAAFAARLRGLGLTTDTVVALQLPNTVDGIIALLGVMRARMIAAPVPLLWRQQETVEALSRIGAKAIVTATRIGSVAHGELAMQVAAELFPIRYVCAFGGHLPDGVVPLDDIFGPDAEEAVPAEPRPGTAAAHVAAVTFDLGAEGLIPVARSHAELIAGGLAAFQASGAALEAPLFSAIPPSSFAGMALTLVPWLMSGGTLSLHHAFDPQAFAAQCRRQDGGTIVLPGPALAAIAAAGSLGDMTKTIAALWRSPERMAASAAWRGIAALIDVASFGEIGLVAANRDAHGLAASIPSGTANGLETLRTAAGLLALRGPMVPTQVFPPGADSDHEPHLKADAAGFVESGYGCRRDGDGLAITGARGGITTVGGYRFRQREVDAQVAAVDPAATIIALPDALLGQKLAGGGADPATMAARLTAHGVNALIAGAFRHRNAA